MKALVQHARGVARVCEGMANLSGARTCHMRRRIHECHMRVWLTASRHSSIRRSHMSYEEEDTCMSYEGMANRV